MQIHIGVCTSLCSNSTMFTFSEGISDGSGVGTRACSFHVMRLARIVLVNTS